MRKSIGWQILLLLLIPYDAAAQTPVEELPPPNATSAPAPNPPAAVDEQQAGWGLTGSKGRHYFVGHLGVVDYLRDGRRQIVLLAEESASSLARPDSNYLYYREQSTGHRWAIGRHAGGDRRYSVYFQAAESSGVWTLYHRAHANWDGSTAAQAPVLLHVEQMCGSDRLDLIEPQATSYD